MSESVAREGSSSQASALLVDICDSVGGEDESGALSSLVLALLRRSG
jgi:serine/threonine protein phosphatase PrpC